MILSITYIISYVIMFVITCENGPPELSYCIAFMFVNQITQSLALGTVRHQTISMIQVIMLMDDMQYSRELAKKVYDAIDADKNGVISRDEWNYAMLSYFWNTKPGHAFNCIFGVIDGE